MPDPSVPRPLIRLNAALHRITPFTRRQRLLWIAAALILLHWPFIGHIHKALGKQHGDWLSIYNIARHSVETGTLRAADSDDTVITERYPPIARPLLMLLGLPPRNFSAVLSFALFAFLYGWCALRLGEIFLKPSPAGRWLATAIALAIVSSYIWADLAGCNLTSVLFWSVTAAFVFDRRDRPFTAGMALSVGILLKMIPAICLAYFLIRRKWRAVWGTLCGILLLGLVPSLAIFGPRQLWDYHGYWYREEFSKFTPMATIDRPIECLYQNQAVVRTMIRLFTHTNAGHSTDPFYVQIAEPPRWELKAAYVAIMASSVAALLWLLWRQRKEVDDFSAAGCYALCVGSMLWLSPWVASYYFGLAMWPALALLSIALSGRRSTRSAGIALLLWLLFMPSLASLTLRAIGASMWGVLMLLVALAVLIVRDKPESLGIVARDQAGRR